MDELEKQLRYGENEPETTDNQGGESPLAAMARNVLSGNSFLVMIILLGVRILASISSSLVSRSTIYYNLGEYFEEYLGADAAAEYYNMINSADMLGKTGNILALISSIIVSTPIILTLVGYILVHVKAKSNETSMNIVGLKILKIMNMMGFVGYIILAAFCLLIPIIGALAMTLVETEVASYTGVVITVLVVIGIFSAAFLLLYIFRNWGFHKSIKCLETVLTEGRVNGKVSEFAAVFTIVLGVIGSFGFFGNLIVGNWAGCLLIIGSSGYMISLGLNMLKLSRVINQSAVQ